MCPAFALGQIGEHRHKTGDSALHKAFKNHIGLIKTGLDGLGGGNVVDHNRHRPFPHGRIVKGSVDSGEGVKVALVRLGFGNNRSSRRCIVGRLLGLFSASRKQQRENYQR